MFLHTRCKRVAPFEHASTFRSSIDILSVKPSQAPAVSLGATRLC